MPETVIHVPGRIVSGLLIASLSVILSACSTSVFYAEVPTDSTEADNALKQFPDPPQGQAGIYVYRNAIVWGGPYVRDVYIDGICLGALGPGYYIYTTAEGNKEHVVSTESEFSPNSIKLYMEADRNYYINQYMRPGFTYGSELERVTAAEGQEAIKQYPLAARGHCDVMERIDTSDAEPANDIEE